MNELISKLLNYIESISEMKKLFFIVDNGLYEASKHLSLTLMKAKIQRIIDVRAENRAIKLKQIKEIAKRTKVQFERVENFSNSDSAFAGLMSDIRGNALFIINESQLQMLSKWQSEHVEMTQVVPKNFNVSFVKLVEKEEEEVEALEVKKETEKKRKNYKEKIPVVYETETGDPDDMFAIAYIVSRPEWELVGLTVNPGSVQQIKTMQALCRELEVSPLIGSFDISHQRASSGRIWLDMCDISNCSGVPDGSGEEVYTRLISDFGSRLLIISGAPMKCMGQFFKNNPDAEIDLWVAQGGFAGDNIVPPEHRLKKFEGMTECPTFNFGGCQEAINLLENTNIKKKILVSKNVCHGVIFNRSVLDLYTPGENIGLNFIYRGMQKYLARKSCGKKFHDPLACVVAICEVLGLDQPLHFEQVEMYKTKGKFGCVRSDSSNTFISTGMKSLNEFWWFFWQLNS